MKKILYTLMIGLTIVSCDKTELNEGVSASSINPTERSVEIDPMSDIDISGLIERLQSSTAKNSPKSGSLTSKDGVAGTSYISIYTGIIDGDLFEISFDDTHVECNPAGSGLTHLTLTYETNGDTAIRLGDFDSEVVIVTITDDLSFLYALDIKEGVKIDGSTRATTAGTVSGDTFTFD